MDFATYKGSLADDAPPEGLSMAVLALWWRPRATGTLRINACKSRPTRKAPGRTPICTGSREICRTPAAGIAAPAALSRPHRCRRNGRRSRGRCWVEPHPQRLCEPAARSFLLVKDLLKAKSARYLYACQ